MSIKQQPAAKGAAPPTESVKTPEQVLGELRQDPDSILNVYRAVAKTTSEALKNIEPGEDLALMFFSTRGGTTVCQQFEPVSGAGKERQIGMMAELVAEIEPVAFTLVVTAWSSRSSAAPPSSAPDRQEVLVTQVMMLKGPMMTIAAPIRREDRGVITLGPPESLSGDPTGYGSVIPLSRHVTPSQESKKLADEVRAALALAYGSDGRMKRMH